MLVNWLFNHGRKETRGWKEDWRKTGRVYHKHNIFMFNKMYLFLYLRETKVPWTIFWEKKKCFHVYPSNFVFQEKNLTQHIFSVLLSTLTFRDAYTPWVTPFNQLFNSCHLLQKPADDFICTVINAVSQPARDWLKNITSQQCLLTVIDISIWYTFIFSTLSTPNSR